MSPLVFLAVGIILQFGASVSAALLLRSTREFAREAVKQLQEARARVRELEGSTAAGDVCAERRRQRAKYPEAHDDEHAAGEFSREAVAFIQGVGHKMCDPRPRPVRQRLVIAAALLIAEVERLDRRHALSKVRP